MNKEDYIEEIVLHVVEELNRLNEDESLDLIELLKNNISIQILPARAAYSGDETIPQEDEDIQDLVVFQKEILDRVINELQKKNNPILLN